MKEVSKVLNQDLSSCRINTPTIGCLFCIALEINRNGLSFKHYDLICHSYSSDNRNCRSQTRSYDRKCSHWYNHDDAAIFIDDYVPCSSPQEQELATNSIHGEDMKEAVETYKGQKVR